MNIVMVWTSLLYIGNVLLFSVQSVDFSHKNLVYM